MSADDPAFWPAHRQAAAIRNRDVSSTELLEHYLGRIERLNPALNAVVTLVEEPARVAARAADDATAAGGELGPLHGVPHTIKDAIETAGIRSTGGAVELAEHVPLHDAPAVAALKRAGSIVFGKTNLPRWSGDGQSYNELFGVTNNPWDVTRTPGGSSGGAAAAVAAGLTSFEVGTDIGGSVRMPSTFSGIWGHKPSFGLIPTLGYLDCVGGGRIEADVNVFGPMTRSVEDLELLLGILAGPTPDRAPAWRVELAPPRHTELREFRVGAWLDDPACPIDDEIAAVLADVVSALEGAGVTVDRHARPAIDFAEAAKLGTQLISVATSVSLSAAELDALAEKSRGAANLAQRHHTWLARHLRRTELRAAWAEYFRAYDVLLCPVSATSAFTHRTEGNWRDRTLTISGAERPYTDLVNWTSMVGMAYLPVTTPPLGLTASGLPVSVQVVAPYCEDRTALHFARLLAELTGGGYTQPPGWA
ncbi:MAG: amidase [Acidimicrobiales bacterium]|nr:amidase [Acidimicrobiales bacterium]